MALCVLASALRAQGAGGTAPSGGADARDRALLARAESLAASLRVSRQARAATSPGARVFRDRGLTIVVDGAATDAEVRAAVDTASALLDEFGAVPREFIATSLFVWSSARDTTALLSGGGFSGWRRVVVLVSNVARAEGRGAQALPGFGEAGWPIARAALAGYAATLDEDWRAWLPVEYGLIRTTLGGEARPWQMFTPASSGVGARCLNGTALDCRVWLGLDRVADPYTTRYGGRELRAHFQRTYSAFLPLEGTSQFRACVAGSDSACVAFARQRREPEPIPADAFARRSLLRAVHDVYGAPALARAIADTVGSIGERLARGARVSEDSLVLVWRRRVLGIGGAMQSRAGAKEAVPALLFAGVLLLAAAGSGRWR